MKHSRFFAFFRRFLILLLLLGLVFVAAYFLPFEQTIGFLNSLAPDGEYESLTGERYQVISRVSALVGLILLVSSGFMLAKWTVTQEYISRFFVRVRDFSLSLREDAKVFLTQSSIARLNKMDRWVILGIMLVAVSLRLASLNFPLTHDEAYSFNAFASESLWVTVSDYHLPNNHVFLNVIINIFTSFFGDQLWLIRLPTMIVGVLMVPAAYSAGKRFYGREVGLLSAGLVAVFPILVLYSVQARGYILMSLFALLTLYMGDVVREDKNRFAWVLLVVFSALGFFTIPIMLFPFGALYIWLFLSWLLGDVQGYDSRFDFLCYWLVSGFASAFLTVFLYLPILTNNFDRFFNNDFIAPLERNIFPAVITVRLRNTWFEWVESIPDWLVIVGLVGLVLELILHFKLSRHKIPQQVAFLLWIAMYLIARRPDTQPRMWLFLAAPVLIWSAGGIVGTLKVLSSPFEKKLPLAQWFVGAAVLAILLFGVWTLPTIPDRLRQKSNLENVAVYLAENIREGDMVTASTVFFPQLRYYFNLYGVDPDYLRRSGPFQRVFIIVGWRNKNTLESEAPKEGGRLAIDLERTSVILQFEEMTVYEAYPAP